MTKAEKIYERFIYYEWDKVSDSLKENILRAINEALILDEKGDVDYGGMKNNEGNE